MPPIPPDLLQNVPLYDVDGRVLFVVEWRGPLPPAFACGGMLFCWSDELERFVRTAFAQAEPQKKDAP